MFKSFIDILFPLYCACCNKADVELCENCLSKIISLKCDETTHYQNKNWFSCMVYDEQVRRLILSFKDCKRRDINDYIKAICCGFLEQINFDVLIDDNADILVIPAPSTKQSISKRGELKTDIYAKEMFKVFLYKYYRKKYVYYKGVLDIKGKKQVKVQGRNRGENRTNINIKSKFNALVKGKTCILIDDIITSGSTLIACTNSLVKNGAKKVICLSLSKVIFYENI